MRTVIFAKRYIHPLPDGHAEYPAGARLAVSAEVEAAARNAGALKPEKRDASRKA
ncbi:hypothetical protein [Brevundimonas pondensis]|uniref:Uncharacterized protein n=1 Tax=Brevundimonas pondensis TaxID=2774189 RepID=A0ABX7SLG4_9CAUL|nr:hypothetical protein [Brevundimonas pondensis]QTC88184.1 hypothetical protein IFE19_01900 [Brevundimonas pondensis]